MTVLATASCNVQPDVGLHTWRILSGSLSSCSYRARCSPPSSTPLFHQRNIMQRQLPYIGMQCCQLHRRPAGRCVPWCRAVAQVDGCATAAGDWQSRAPRQRTYDVVSFGNLCVDIVLQVDHLPPPDSAVRWQLLQDLSASPPDVSSWEVGGACNFMIAAARLGMRVGCVGQLGDDVYGSFLREVMAGEGMSVIEPVLFPPQQLAQTLLCFVLVGPAGNHAFCSRYDFGPWPLVDGAAAVPASVEQMLQATNAVYLNGFVFDELEPQLVVAVARMARRAGASVFFDPGPRCWTLLEGNRREALDSILSLSDVVLMTEEEAAAVTGCSNAEEAAYWVLGRADSETDWCIVKRGGDGAVLCSRSACTPLFTAEAYKVDVRDTVGCGDSFAAAVVMGWNANHSIPTVMALANAVGAATAMGTGAGRNVASVDNVVDLLLSSVDDEEGKMCVHSAALQVLQSATKLGQVSMDEAGK